MKIAFMTKYHEDGPSSRARSYAYRWYFKQGEHSVSFHPLMYDGYIRDLFLKKKNPFKVFFSIMKRIGFMLFKKHRYDLLVIEKELFHNAPGWFERMLLAATPYTLDFDDAHFLRYSTGFKKLTCGRKLNSMAKRARLITVGNHWYFERIRGNLEYLPTCIDLAYYQPDRIRKHQGEQMVLVWIGSPTTVKYLIEQSYMLLQLSQMRLFTLRVIGAEMNIPGLQIQCVPFNAKRQFEMLSSCDIGLMPLEDTDWEDGKCGYKLLQYMASCLPSVASPAAANREICIEGETGYLAVTEDEWLVSLTKLIDDAELRRNMGERARERVSEHYSYDVWGPRYVEILEHTLFKPDELDEIFDELREDEE